MNREILFRGKRKDNNEWVYGYYSPLNFPIFGNQGHFINEDGYKAVEIKLETLGQFTGLTDKNDKKIFEGDIIAKGFELYVVRWNPEQVRWGIYSDNYEVAGFTKFSESYFEVVGNVYDNEELLEND